MARVKDPLHSTDAKGTVGGLTYAMWNGVNTVRVKSKPVRRLRTTQPRNRAILGYLSRYWGDLTDAQRALWEDYASNHPQPDGFGGVFIMSGINAYVMLNHSIIRLYGFGSEIEEPPVEDPPATISQFTASTGATNPGDIDLEWVHGGTPEITDINEIRMAGPFISPGKVNVFERKVHIANPGGTVVELTIEDLVEGAWYWFFIRYMDEYGQVTAWLTDQATPKLTP